MPKSMTVTEKESPTTAAYAELLKDVQEKVKKHRFKAEAFKNMLDENQFDSPELAMRMYRHHNQIANVQNEVANAIRQMNHDYLCDSK